MQEYPEEITIKWTVDDVLSMAHDSGVYTFEPKITRQEAARVLHEVERHHDANEGVSWSTLDFWLNKLYGARRVEV